MNKFIGFLLGILAFVLSGCGSNTANGVVGKTLLLTPTLHSLFMDDEGTSRKETGIENAAVTPTVAGFFLEMQTPISNPTVTPSPTENPSGPTLSLSETMTMTIYSDSYNRNWSLLSDEYVKIDSRTMDPVQQGRYSIAVTPLREYSTVNFVVKENAQQAFPRNQVLGFRFWINPGVMDLSPSDLVVSILGSNAYPYYVEGDESVTNTIKPVFSETRLYYLGINRAVPPHTWEEVVIWLDDLIYDPDFEYVVGFYIKNDEFLVHTIYIDNVQLILANGETLPERAEQK